MYDGGTRQDVTARGAYTDQVTQLVEARTTHPVDEAAVAAQLACLSTLAEPPSVGGAGR